MFTVLTLAKEDFAHTGKPLILQGLQLISDGVNHWVAKYHEDSKGLIVFKGTTKVPMDYNGGRQTTRKTSTYLGRTQPMRGEYNMLGMSITYY